MTDIKIDRETAELEFERFCEMARIDMDQPRNDNDRRALEEERDVFIYLIQKGRYRVDEEGCVTVVTESEKIPEIRFGRRTLAPALRAADKVKSTSENSKLLAMMADHARIPTTDWNHLHPADLQNCIRVYNLFLG